MSLSLAERFSNERHIKRTAEAIFGRRDAQSAYSIIKDSVQQGLGKDEILQQLSQKFPERQPKALRNQLNYLLWRFRKLGLIPTEVSPEEEVEIDKELGMEGEEEDDGGPVEPAGFEIPEGDWVEGPEGLEPSEAYMERMFKQLEESERKRALEEEQAKVPQWRR